MAQARVMFLGDSLVRGDEATIGGHRSFRGRLMQQLVQGNYDVSVVGSQQLAPALGVGHHEPFTVMAASADGVIELDAEADGVSDGDEVLTLRTDPLATDSDRDGLADGANAVGAI